MCTFKYDAVRDGWPTNSINSRYFVAWFHCSTKTIIGITEELRNWYAGILIIVTCIKSGLISMF